MHRSLTGGREETKEALAVGTEEAGTAAGTLGELQADGRRELHASHLTHHTSLGILLLYALPPHSSEPSHWSISVTRWKLYPALPLLRTLMALTSARIQAKGPPVAKELTQPLPQPLSLHLLPCSRSQTSAGLMLLGSPALGLFCFLFPGAEMLFPSIPQFMPPFLRP